MGKLDGKVAIVTGAAQGIGAAYSRRFAEEGATVALADLRDEQAKTVAADIAGATGAQTMAIRADVADDASAHACVAAVLDRFGRVDVLVNNAGLFYDLEMTNTTYDYFRKVMDVNFYGTVHMSRAVFKPMRRQGGGSIINQASTAAYNFNIAAMEMVMGGGSDDPERELPLSPYAFSKAAVTQLTKFLAGGVGRYGIRVNAISPGVTMTEATRKMVPENLIGMITMMTALGKTLEPTDLVGACVFLASDDSTMMTGQTLVVDAGQFMLG